MATLAKTSRPRLFGPFSAMRTALTIDEPIAAALKNLAQQSGKPFKRVVNETLRAGLARRRACRAGHRQGAGAGRRAGGPADRPQAAAAQMILLDAIVLIYAIENGCAIASTDNAFRRFAGLKCISRLR